MLMRDKEKRNKLRQELYQALEKDGESLPKVVKALRKILAKDQNDFCKFTGIGLATLRKIEQGRGNVSLRTVEKILKKFSMQLVVKLGK